MGSSGGERSLFAALGLEVHGRGVFQDAEGERFGQVEVDALLVVTRVLRAKLLYLGRI